jgi:hypothetical protein
VARVITNIRTMTAQRTQLGSVSGMPAYGQTFFEAAAVPAYVGVQVSTCARVRHIGDMGLATAKGFPGTSAWRPPSC